MKHKLKMWLRELYARGLYHTGLHAVVDRLMPRRLTILFGHCVDEPAVNGFLPADMKIAACKLEEIVERLARRYTICTVGEGYDIVCGSKRRRGKSAVALSVDDGYRDNHTALKPLLEKLGVRATIFLETAPLDEGKVNWSHKYHWVLTRWSHRQLVERYAELSTDAATVAALHDVLAGGARLAYHLKRILKYEAAEADRDRVLDRIFEEAGGDERELCRTLYLDWDQARELRSAGFELGGHTVHHAILSRLGEEEARAEVEGCQTAMERALGAPGTVFAYPFGRRWDYDGRSARVVREAGFRLAVNTHAGTNDSSTDPLQLRRLPIDDHTRMHLVATEACGGFELLRRFGLDLSE